MEAQHEDTPFHVSSMLFSVFDEWNELTGVIVRVRFDAKFSPL